MSILIIPQKGICFRRNGLRFCSLDACTDRVEFNTPDGIIIEVAHQTYRTRFKGYIQSGQVEVDDVYMPADTLAQALGLR
jgi:hypothetical protein